MEQGDKNSNVWKDKIRILPFGMIRQFQCLVGWDKNSNVWKNKIRIPMSGRIRKEI